ncbi:MAG TPA: UDP-2,4-diacetamido-2,4,6-trideoxy-beta-L-altropyranose hydrolase [Verrucomicrobiae bacterium]|nr:UDP-2,4-diacetamido-2,4,6-trideoxy-beta-L-altropyranose hydrolase [Verrucomicrobiae bacterium]
MTIAIMQPTYFPWLGYFDLIDQSDLFVFLDNVQFERRSWQQRNRIKTSQGLEYLTVPVLKAGRYEQLVRDVEIVRSGLFPDKHLRVIEQHYRRCPYFNTYFPQLAEILKSPITSLAALNEQIIRRLAGLLGLRTPFRVSSSLKAQGRRAGLLAAICEEVGATTYLSPIGSFEYLQTEHVEFDRLAIPIVFQNFEHPQYRQQTAPFVPYASVLDLLFNEGEAAREIIRSGRRPPFSLEELARLRLSHGVILPKSDFVVSPVEGTPATCCSLLIRADGNTTIGTGHVMRCLALAEGWRDTREDAAFAMRTTTEPLNERLRQQRFESRQLTAIMGTGEGALQTIAVAQAMQSEWVVLDGCNFKGDYQQQIKEAGLKVLTVDDYGHAETYPADIVLNQNLAANPQWYARRGQQTRLLLGPRYVLLRRQFAAWKDWRREIAPLARKVLITLGGADADNITSQVIESLRGLDVELKVVVGGSNPHFNQLCSLIQPPCSILRDALDMPDLMAWADVAVSASGLTSCELAFMGLPHLVLALEEKQRPNVEALDAAGVARKTTPDRLADDLRALLNDASWRAKMSRRGRELVDGQGVSRVIANLRAASLALRPAREDDAHLFGEWAGDPGFRAALRLPVELSREACRQWFCERVNAPNAGFYLATNSGNVPLGQIYFEVRGDEAFLFAGLAKEFRGRRYGAGLILRGSEQCFADRPVKRINAACLPQNTAAVRALKLAGYHDSGEAAWQNQSLRHFILDR